MSCYACNIILELFIFLIKIYWLWYCVKDNKIDWGWSLRSSGQ